MFKLLTEEESRKVRHEYAMRRMVIILSSLILVLVVGVIGLLPTYVLSTIRYNEAQERSRIVANGNQREASSDPKAWLSKINRQLRILSPKLDTDRPSDLIDEIVDQRTSGIKLTGFSWVKSDGKINLTISGTSRDRQTLLSFESRVNALDNLSDVTLPISNLAKDKNIDFQIKLSQSQ